MSQASLAVAETQPPERSGDVCVYMVPDPVEVHEKHTNNRHNKVSYKSKREGGREGWRKGGREGGGKEGRRLKDGEG